MLGASRLGMAATIAAVLLLAGGCTTATDRHVFESTRSLPTSVEVVDVIDNRVIWEKDVPPDHRLILEFQRRNERTGHMSAKRPATGMNWALYEINGTSAGATRRQYQQIEREFRALEGRAVMMRVSYGRPVPGTDQLIDELDPTNLPTPEELQALSD